MAALTGNSIASTYTGLIKTSDSGARGAEGSADQCSDGAGNTIPLFVSATEVYAIGSGTGTSHTAFGKDCGVDLAAGTGNSLFGEGAGADLSTGEHNVALGYRALYQGTTETDDCVAIGYNAMSGAWTTAAVNDCVVIGSGAGAGALVAAASGLTAIGKSALAANTSGAKNTAVGYSSLVTNVDGSNNTALGYESLTTFEADTPNHGENTGVGYRSGKFISTGTQNTFLGSGAGQGVDGTELTGDQNTAVGIESGVLLQGSGNQNTFLGGVSGNTLTTGSNNVCLGYSAVTDDATATNQIVIGHSTTGVADNSVTLGNASVTAVYMAQDSGATVHCAGIDMSVTSNAGGMSSEVLDDYEEGTFGTSSANGILKDGGTGSVTCGSYYTCSYTKIGRLVTVNGYVVVSATSSPDGTLKIVLPFTSAQITHYGGFAAGTVALHEAAYASSVQLAMTITEATTEADITEFATGAGLGAVSAADLSSSDAVWFTLQYIT